MICGRSIRRLTAAERERADDRHKERYDRVYNELAQEALIEYETSFGPVYRALHPYKADGSKLHFATLKRIKDEGED